MDANDDNIKQVHVDVRTEEKERGRERCIHQFIQCDKTNVNTSTGKCEPEQRKKITTKAFDEFKI